MELSNRAQALAAAIPRTACDPTAVAAAEESAHRGECWAVAFSGGSDSLALLLLLWAHWPSQRSRLRALHFNHCLRGEESDQDERFCQEVCADLGVLFVTAKWANPPPNPGEDDARQARLQFFETALGSEDSATLFTGHQLDDVLETFFMRAARGASCGGLAAPRPAREWGKGRRILRPLLSLGREEIAAALRAAGITWREDSTNRTDVYLRNRVRLQVIPAWLDAVGAGARKGAAVTRRWLEEDDAALEAWLDELGVSDSAEEIPLGPLAGKPQALWRRAVHRWTPSAALSRQAFEELVILCQAGRGRMSVGPGFAVLEAGWLRFQPASDERGDGWPTSSLVRGCLYFLPGGATLRVEASGVTPQVHERLRTGQVDPAVQALVDVSGALFMRCWQAGDRYRPLGAPGSAKLQDLFTNRKVPLADRSRVPVICSSDGQIVWVPGLPPADHCKLTQHSVTAVQLTYHPGTSTVRKQS